jgi:hypothetical protein
MKKIHSHPGPVVSAPLTITPIDAALPPTAPKMASDLLRAGPSGNVLTRIDNAAGAANAAPSPWPARAATNWPSDPASPAVSDATVNSPRPPTSTCRRPSRSAARPPSSRKPPSTSP